MKILKLNQTIRFTSSIILVMLIFGCQKEELNQTVEPEMTSDNIESYINLEEPNLEQINEILEVYTYLIASSLDVVELRSVIKDEAKLRFDGDYDVLTSKLESIILPTKNIQVRELLTSRFSDNYQTLINREILSNVNLTGDVFLEIVSQVIPNLQVAVPLHCEKWDVQDYIPLVAVRPYDFDEQKVKYVKAFNTYGDEYQLSTKVEPEEPVIVVGVSERIDKDGKRRAPKPYRMTIEPNVLKSAPSAPSSISVTPGSANQLVVWWPDVSGETSYEIYRRVHNTESQFWYFATTAANDNDYINSWIPEGYKVSYKVRAVNGDGHSGWSPIGTRHSSGRDDGDALRVEAVSFETTAALNAVESWIAGAPEIRLRVVRGSESGASTVFVSGVLEPPNRASILGQFWHCQAYVAPWYPDGIGTVLTFDWREEDPSSNVSFSISGSWEDPSDGGIKAGGSVIVTHDRGDAHIGTNTVFHWDPTDTWYEITDFWYFFTPV